MGPLLVRNPGLLRELLSRMTGEDCSGLALPLAEKALELTLAEFGELVR